MNKYRALTLKNKKVKRAAWQATVHISVKDFPRRTCTVEDKSLPTPVGKQFNFSGKF